MILIEDRLNGTPVEITGDRPVSAEGGETRLRGRGGGSVATSGDVMDLLDGILSVAPRVGSIVVDIAIMSVLRRRGKDRKRKYVLASGRRTYVRADRVVYDRANLRMDRLRLKKVGRCSRTVMES
jgi:hypothetical protein